MCEVPSSFSGWGTLLLEHYTNIESGSDNYVIWITLLYALNRDEAEIQNHMNKNRPKWKNVIH